MMKKICGFLLLCLSLQSTLLGQDGDITLHHFTEHYLNRLDIRGLLDTTYHSYLRPLPREYVAKVLLKTDTSKFSYKDLHTFFRVRQLVDDAYNDTTLCSEDLQEGIFKWFSFIYQNKRDFFSFRNSFLRVYINPIIQFRIGLEQSNRPSSSPNLFQNTRGASFRARIGKKLGIYSEFLENQYRYPSFVRFVDSTAVLRGSIYPGVAFWKPFKTNGIDFSLTKAYFTYSPLPALRFKVGKDRNYLGNGMQSLFLSDFAVDYWFFNARLDLKKFLYFWQVSQMIDFIPGKPDNYGRQPAKYAVHHQLYWTPAKWIALGVFETVIYASANPNGQRRFELQYLNPLIFYRTAEQFLGSADNALLGFSYKINLFKTLQLYGQLLIDDYNFGNRKLGKGWWGNKWGLQAGLQYINVATIDNLDLQMEFNRISPYTYAHMNPASNYSHYGQMLAYSYGANAQNLSARLIYQIIPRLYLTAEANFLKKGMDFENRNYGGNIFRSNNSHFQDFNNTVLQGKLLDLKVFYGKISYQLFYTDIYFELEAWRRMENAYREWIILGGIKIGGLQKLWNL